MTPKPDQPNSTAQPFDAAATKRINRAVQTAKEAAHTLDGLAEIKLRRFHRAMEALQSTEEGEAVYDRLRSERWYQAAADALARVK